MSSTKPRSGMHRGALAGCAIALVIATAAATVFATGEATREAAAAGRALDRVTTLDGQIRLAAAGSPPTGATMDQLTALVSDDQLTAAVERLRADIRSGTDPAESAAAALTLTADRASRLRAQLAASEAAVLTPSTVGLIVVLLIVPGAVVAAYHRVARRRLGSESHARPAAPEPAVDPALVPVTVPEAGAGVEEDEGGLAGQERSDERDRGVEWERVEHTGAGGPDDERDPDDETPKAPETSQTSETPGGPETDEISETPETPGAPETSEMSETSETPETPGGPETDDPDLMHAVLGAVIDQMSGEDLVVTLDGDEDLTVSLIEPPVERADPGDGAQLEFLLREAAAAVHPLPVAIEIDGPIHLTAAGDRILETMSEVFGIFGRIAGAPVGVFVTQPGDLVEITVGASVAAEAAGLDIDDLVSGLEAWTGDGVRWSKVDDAVFATASVPRSLEPERVT